MRSRKDLGKLRALQLEYFQRTREFIKILCDIENVTIHKMIITDSGEFHKQENYSAEAARLRAMCLREIDSIRAEIDHRAKEISYEIT